MNCQLYCRREKVLFLFSCRFLHNLCGSVKSALSKVDADSRALRDSERMVLYKKHFSRRMYSVSSVSHLTPNQAIKYIQKEF